MREHRTLEFKERISNSFLKTVSAYANYGTGQIVFGVTDDGSIVGVDNPTDVSLSIENMINDAIKPVPNFTIAIDDKNRTISLTVYQGDTPPYLYKSKAYRRHDTSTVEVGIIELKRLIQMSENLSYDRLLSKESDLSFKLLESSMQEQLGITGLSEDLLITLGLLDKQKGYTIGAELMADTNRFHGIDIARFGESINVIQYRKTLEHTSLIGLYLQALEIFKQYYEYEEIKGSYRELRELIPEEAFREALINALVHREWDIPAHIKLEMYGDRIEIISPGGLPEHLSFEEYRDRRISILRNPIIGNVFFRLHLIEGYGTGISRIIQSYKTSHTKPTFESTDHAMHVTLPVLRTDIDEMSHDEKLIYHLIRLGVQSATSLSKESRFGKTKVVAILNRLIEDGYIVKTGAARGTKYKLA